MNYLDEKTEHFAKTAFAKNLPKPQKNQQTTKKKKTRAGSTKCMWNVCHITVVK